MRLTDHQAAEIVRLANQLAGMPVQVRLFGSRLDDHAKGGNLDLMIELPAPITEPALLAARLSSGISRLFDGRKVDILLSAPNLMRFPIHEIAGREGRML